MSFFERFVFSAVAFGIVVSAAGVGATGTLRFCARWPTEFLDSSGTGGKEDWFYSKGVVHRTAQYSYAKVKRWNNGASRWDTLVSGLMEESSGGYACLPTVTRSSVDQLYHLEMGTYLRRGDRIIEILHDNGDFDDRQVYWVVAAFADFGPYNSDDDANVTFNSGRSKQTSMAVVARQVLALGNTLGVKNNTNERIVINMEYGNPNECRGGGLFYDRKRSFPYNQVCYSTDAVSLHKFVAGHELGHAVSGMNYGPLHAVPTADTDSFWETNLSQCTYGPVDKPTHHLQSREYIGTAQSEGFAHFVSATLFNARDVNGYYHYYKTPVYKWINGSPEPSWEDQDLWRSMSSNMRWMASSCAIGKSWMGDDTLGLGIEGDWMHFFWQLWSENVDVSTLTDIWRNVDGAGLSCSSKTACLRVPLGIYQIGEEWHDLYDEVDPAMRDLFLDKAEVNGVNTEYNW